MYLRVNNNLKLCNIIHAIALTSRIIPNCILGTWLPIQDNP